MKNILICLVVIIFSSSLYSQSLRELDAKNGFKDFELGDSFTKWTNVIFIEYTEGNEITCLYTGTCCRSVFEFPVDEIILTFQDEILVMISIKLVNFQKFYNRAHTVFGKQGYPELNSKFIQLYGQPTFYDVPQSGKPYHIIKKWSGGQVVLEYLYKYIGANEGEYVIVNLISKPYSRKKLNQGF